MAAWSVIVWAVVTPDLELALQADLVELAAALGTKIPDDEIHVHVNIVRGTRGSATMWPPGAGDARADDDLAVVLTGATCWNQDTRHRLLVLWGHGVLAFPLQGPDAGVPDAGRVAAAVGSTLPKPHIVGYDACQMATVRTVRQLAAAFPDAHFVGSMVPEPVSGWPYADLVQILRQPWEPKAVAAAIVQAYAASLTVPDLCMVALELACINNATTGLTDCLTALMATSPPPDRVNFFAAADGADILEDTNLADLGALMRRLQVDKPNPEAAAVVTAIREATLARRSAGGLSGRDGIGVRLGVPWGPGAPDDQPWPDQPQWTDYLPEV